MYQSSGQCSKDDFCKYRSRNTGIGISEPVPDVTETVAPEVIIAEINSIGPVTLESETIMNTIRTQYNALPDADKAKITNYQILVDDEVQLAALKAASGQ